MENTKKKPTSIRTKLWLSLCAIAAVLFVSGTVSIIEFSRLSDYVSRSLIEDLDGMKAAESLGNICRSYNYSILAEVGSADSHVEVHFDQKAALERCDSAAQVLSVRGKGASADSIQVRVLPTMLRFRCNWTASSCRISWIPGPGFSIPCSLFIANCYMPLRRIE